MTYTSSTKIFGWSPFKNKLNAELSLFNIFFLTSYCVMFWPFDQAKNAIQGDAPEGSDTF